jgi:hypothetical protein
VRDHRALECDRRRQPSRAIAHVLAPPSLPVAAPRRAAELLNALPDAAAAAALPKPLIYEGASSACTALVAAATQEQEDAAVDDAYLFAKALFDQREYARCAHALDAAHDPAAARAATGAPAGAAPGYPPRALFLRCYALYLVRPPPMPP